MSRPAPVRRGGATVLPDGDRLVWSVAEGARGRRWRWWRSGPVGTGLAALLETAPDGRHTRLELAGPDGLLTLHPEPDGRSAHGNVVTPDGIRHLALQWGPGWRFDVERLPWIAAVPGGGEGEGDASAPGGPSLRIAADFSVAPATLGPLPPIDPDGLPADLPHEALELRSG